MILQRLLGAPLLLSLALVLVACTQEPEPVVFAEGEMRGSDYYHPGLGWTLPVPAGWDALGRAEIARLNDKGQKMIEKTVGEPIPDEQTELIYLRRGTNSYFTSASQPFDEASDGSYSELQQAIFEVVLQSYKDAGINSRHERAKETIDGVDFEVIHVTLLSPDGNREIAQQRMYDALLGRFGLTVSVTSAFKGDRDTMLAAWRASKFDASRWASPAPAAADAASTIGDRE